MSSVGCCCCCTTDRHVAGLSILCFKVRLSRLSRAVETANVAREERGPLADPTSLPLRTGPTSILASAHHPRGNLCTELRTPLKRTTMVSLPSNDATSSMPPSAALLEDIILSARYGELEEVESFLSSFGIQPLADARDERGNGCLHMAAANGHNGG